MAQCRLPQDYCFKGDSGYDIKYGSHQNWCTTFNCQTCGILAVFRILGRGYFFDGEEEVCFISAEILRNFFNKFSELFATKYFDTYCNYQETKEEIKKSNDIYARMRLPG